MKRLFRYLLGSSARSVSPGVDGQSQFPVAAAAAPDWLPEHRLAWSGFLGTPAGVVFWARLSAVRAHVATSACKDAFHTAHSAGTANGWAECQAWLESLSRSSRVSDDLAPDGATDSHPKGESDLAELLSP